MLWVPLESLLYTACFIYYFIAFEAIQRAARSHTVECLLTHWSVGVDGALCRYWAVWERVVATLLALTTVLLHVLLDSWNLLGFRW